MSSGLKVDYNILNECITSLKEISVGTSGDEITIMISGLANEFDNSNSDATDALKARQSEYNRVNNALIALAANGVSVLEKAKILYEHEDMVMQSEITAN